jgi:hypothetical protein
MEDDAILNFYLELMRVAPTMKHNSFEEEQEWRLVLHRGFSLVPEVNYRSGKSLLVPYVDFKLSLKKSEDVISDVIVGPSPHMSLSVRSAREFLEQNRFSSAIVEGSSIPFRNW